MKHTLFMLLWLALLAFCSLVVGTMALLEYGNAEVIFWNRTPIESKAGKIAWIIISSICLLLFLVLSVREYRRKKNLQTQSISRR